MKKLLFLSLLLSISCSRCFETPQTNNTTTICEQSAARYVPNEIILDAQNLGADYPVFQNFLASKGYKKRDSCNCSHSLELWGNDNNVNVIGDISGAKAQAGVMSGNGWRFSPNFVIIPDFKLERDIIRQDNRKINPPPGTPVRIVIVDTGVEPANTNLSFLWKKSLSTGSVCAAEGEHGLNVPVPATDPLDIQGHGTHLNGIINGVVINTGDQSGVPFEQINVKFTADADHTGSLFKAVCGMYYGLDRGAQVFNLSWGYSGGTAPDLIKSFLETAKTKNVVIIAGAGNFNENNDITPFWPASFSKDYDFVISVGAYDAYYNHPTTPKLFQLYNQTNFGKSVDVFAPGVNVRSTVGTTFATASGTSMAASYVTRVAAIIKGKKPAWRPQEIKQCIVNKSVKQTAVDGRVIRIFDARTAITACQ